MLSLQSSVLPLGDSGSERLARVPEGLQHRAKEEGSGRTEGEEKKEENSNSPRPEGQVGDDMGGGGQSAGGADERMADPRAEEARMKECSLRQVSFKNKAFPNKYC